MTENITVNSRWRGKQTPIEVTVTRVTIRTVSYIGLHGSICGTVPQWLSVNDNGKPAVNERKKKRR